MRDIAFIGHRADRTGAPIGLLLFLRWLRRETSLDFEVVLNRGGDLLAAYRDLARTRVLDPTGPTAPIVRRARAMRLRADLRRRPPRLVFWNSAVSGWALDRLGRIECPVIGRVTECRIAIEAIGAARVRTLCARTTELIAVSDAVARDLEALDPSLASRIRVVPECVPTPESVADGTGRLLRERLGVPADAVLIGAAGTLCWRKGSDLLPQIARSVLERSPGCPVHFVWVGHDASGFERQALRHDLRHLGIGAQVHLPPPMNDLSAFYEAIDVLALPSREDPHPLVALEAGARHVPVVCFEGAGGTAGFFSKDAGVAVPYLDVRAMGDALARLASDPAARRRIGEAAAGKVRSERSTQVVLPRLFERVRARLEGTGGGRPESERGEGPPEPLDASSAVRN
jgi:glycosyltransferase involved in cell wall biosynthesis